MKAATSRMFSTLHVCCATSVVHELHTKVMNVGVLDEVLVTMAIAC